MAKTDTAPFRADIVGSFLRPASLKQARADYAQNKISLQQLRAAEDAAIRDLVQKEKEVGLQAVTDGEFRRRYWHLDFLAALDGVEEVKAEHWSVAFKDRQPKAATLKITGKVDFGSHPFLEHFRFLQSIAEGTLCKMTIPSPSMLHLICCVREEHYQPISLYQDQQALFQDIATAYQKAVRAFYDAGCRYLQLDDTSWGEFCDQEKRKAYAARGLNLDEIARAYVRVINQILEAKPDDMVITMHICRGNFRSTWFSSGGYEPVAEILFGGCHVDGFFLEYDSDRAGSFEPLRFIQNQKVVLGLITSKYPQLEKEADVRRRVEEASQYVKLDQLCLSPQCGFSSTEEGNLMTEEQQWEKVRFVKKVAAQIWP
ncbi:MULTISPECIES: 5-methyltetrahydropteroyltriglutamate--homocysteine S-methyltransferase [Caproicibacterium]|uniref:5-methyltetrahydropteroyltriglutamate--homocysteine S-methyltransferase n=1 Tax=Caproicibacterium argilliputei TaxID=3030016 RepID=A0AA97H228_9FIRM|nr:5-methyltetrahydropteroyltriglutamate--homocysteine S-methyltransferase [Caproicibacterium argilliputei]WOC33151.1 5-methyltetrahydropteroyltriglutamate--homocysteine S-methyltransferase [Caproicibacterium argilliputei]